MSRQLFEEARKVLTQEAAVKLDPVGQEDKDVDNDGDTDKTDSYLKKRRGAISAAIAKSKNESALSEEDLAKLKAILGEIKTEDVESVAEGLDEMQVADKYALKGPQPADVPAYMRKDNARKQFPVTLDDLKRKDTMSDIENLRKMEEVEHVDESARVEKKKYSWGKMVTVHHGSENSYPLHPEHQNAIKKLKDGEHTSFKDETKRKITARREGDKVHLSSAGTNKKTTVAYSHFSEEVEQTAEAMSHQAKTTMRHIPKPTPGERQAAKDIKPGVAGYRDRIAMLRSAEARGGLKKEKAEGVAEEAEQIDELSKETLKSYLNTRPTKRYSTDPGVTKVHTPERQVAISSSLRLARQKLNQKLNQSYEYEQVDQEDFELIENLDYQPPKNPTYQDYFKAALKIAQVESFAELDEEDQQYIMNEMENAFTQNDISFIIEADMMGDMSDTVTRLRKAGHKVEDMGRDYKGNPFYVYVDKTTHMRRKVMYKGKQKVTQNMGKAQPEKEEDNQ